jgi:thioredoxin reductase/NAD-dependent dihydropyrimidine dehydrogenase PreA subunit
MNYLALYLVIAFVVIALYMRRKQRIARAHAAELQEALEAGLAEPASLHPVINPVSCIGSGSCAKACPEGALGIVDNKAVLVNAAACIGHGACYAACPVDAIQLVFGTESRGIDIPHVSPNFETNVQGIFIAGELGGMGLIRKAAEQGRQAVDAIRRRSGGGRKAEYDVVIVGCGPAGLSAGLSCIEHKLRYKLLEQEDSLGGAVYHYPRNKIAMTAPVQLALIGKVKFGEVQKERLLEFWKTVVSKTGLRVAFREQMKDIQQAPDGSFVVKTDRHQYTARSVLLTMGRRGTPRRLDVPGEDSPKVVYRLVDAAQYKGQKVLVVGGGNSALEAAVSISQEPGTTVTLSYRGDAFSRVTKLNRQQVDEQQRRRRLRVVLNSTVEKIDPESVTLQFDGKRERLANDAVIVCAGGLLPTPLLRQIGIEFETKFGTS